MMVLQSRPGTPFGADGLPGWKKVAAVLAAKTAFRRALKRTRLAAAGAAAAANGAATNELQAPPAAMPDAPAGGAVQQEMDPLALDDVRLPPA